MSTLAMAFLFKAGTLTKATANRLSGMQADYLAEAAADHALWRLLNDPGSLADPTVYYMHDLGGGRYGYKVRVHTNTTFAAVATVGVVGDNVVHQSYVMYIKSGPQQMITGAYMGDGTDNRPITNVGFQPDVVIIKAADYGTEGIIRTATMSGESAKPMVGSVGILSNLIQSLDATGFTVGNGWRVNKGGTIYYWAAFRAVAGEMKVGTYTGDGAGGRVISGLGGFQPELIIVLSEENHEVMHRSNYSDLSFNFGNGQGQGNCLTTPVPFDGFRLGSDDRVNKNGVIYHYVCWPNIAGQQQFGGHGGDGQDNRNVTGLGFKPEYVIVRAVSAGRFMIHRTASIDKNADESMYFSSKVNTTNHIQLLLDDGYQLGKDDEVNKLNISYESLAWARK
ncbi:MAG: hypothetical protein P1P89_01620 [Desulfobacterales bacterium]|nr:hypothetical protein [Desulfobacterales bacterium]